MTRTRLWIGLAVVLMTIALVVIVVRYPASPPASAPPAATTHPDGPVPHYTPDAFGPTRWSVVHDAQHTSGRCTVRDVVLERDAGQAAVDLDDDGCRDDGPIVDLYTGQTLPPARVQIDHVLAKADAWYAGAWRWSALQRRLFYLDQSNLRAVAGDENERKGDRGPDEWRPPRRDAWCAYAVIYENTAREWNLTLTPAKLTALAEMRQTCAQAPGR